MFPDFKLVAPQKKLFSNFLKSEYSYPITDEINVNEVSWTLCKGFFSVGYEVVISTNIRGNKHKYHWLLKCGAKKFLMCDKELDLEAS
jgi:hypothetical protein